MGQYRWVAATFGYREGGRTRVIHRGEVLELTDEQAARWKDRIEPVGVAYGGEASGIKDISPLKKARKRREPATTKANDAATDSDAGIN